MTRCLTVAITAHTPSALQIGRLAAVGIGRLAARPVLSCAKLLDSTLLLHHNAGLNILRQLDGM
jgi:hypothetical protein